MARERYLLDESEDTIHANEIVPTTPKKTAELVVLQQGKAFGWRYLCPAFGGIVYSIATKVSPGLHYSPDDLLYDAGCGGNAAGGILTQYAEDRNGDGKTVVTVVNYIFSESNCADGSDSAAGLCGEIYGGCVDR